MLRSPPRDRTVWRSHTHDRGGDRTIWAYWQQGEEDLAAKHEPKGANSHQIMKWGDIDADDVEHKYGTAYRCVKAWRALNPSWTVQLLNLSEARRLSPHFDELVVNGVGDTPILSDVLRLDLLHRYGGVWVDVQVCPVHPLDSWLPQALAPAGFFAPWWMQGPLDAQRDAKCESNLTHWRDGQLGHLWGAAESRVVLTSFIAVDDSQNEILGKWLNRTMGFMRGLAPKQPYPYFLAFCELTKLCLDDEPLRVAIWEKMPRVDGHIIVGDPTCCLKLEAEVDETMLMYKAPMAGANISDDAYARWIIRRNSPSYEFAGAMDLLAAHQLPNPPYRRLWKSI